MRLFAVGVTHRTAPVELRECLDFARAGLDHKRTDLKRFAKEVARELSPAVVAGATAQPIAQPPAAAGASNRKKRNIASREPGAKGHEAMEGKR